MERWPESADELETLQRRLAVDASSQPLWTPGDAGPPLVGAVFATGPRGVGGPGATGDPAWAAAVVMREGAVVDSAVIAGRLGAPYRPGLLALREGPVLERAVRALRVRPNVLLVDATGRDHPRGAGLALHLGWALGIPTVGVTDRVLSSAGASVAVSARSGVRPVRVHPAWRTSAEVAVTVVRAALAGARTPAPLREARRLARSARSGALSV